MRYVMFVCTDTEPDPVAGGPGDDVDRWVTLAGARRVEGQRLRDPSDATVVRVRGGRTLVTDGPFAETKEWIAGFDVLDCADLDEAIALAAAHPMARYGRLELRPFWPFDEE